MPPSATVAKAFSVTEVPALVIVSVRLAVIAGTYAFTRVLTFPWAMALMTVAVLVPVAALFVFVTTQ